MLHLAVCIVFTLVFRAEVEAQAGAYATGVLALILSAAIAVALALWKEFRAGGPVPVRLKTLGLCLFFWIVTGVYPEEQAEPERSEEHTSELQSLAYLVCRLLLEKKKK